MRKHLLILFISVLTTVAAFAQVTTSTITGVVRDSKGASLPGATVLAVHVPSGTKYATAANNDGRYSIVNARPGGPYIITVSFIGTQPQTFSDINLLLAQSFVLNVTLSNGVELKTV